ncbi:MAG: hypothetical protein R3A13_06520 [Bdellovibrionota bacterium]
MNKVEEISKLWSAHEAKSFPEGHRTKVIGKANLTMIESDAASNIITFIHSGGNLVGRRQTELKNNIKILDESLKELSGEAKIYFTSLKQIVERVIELTSEPENITKPPAR